MNAETLPRKLTTVLKQQMKLIVLDRAGKVPDVEESMNEFTNALEEYWQKWESVKWAIRRS